ncbi:MAG: hypothetical protein WBC91_00895 [Phototrophicaceae bacterium]
MGDEQKAKKVVNFSRFDLTVIAIVVCLTVAVSIAAYISSPARLGKMVAYLAPASGDIPNIWLTPIDNPDAARQITFSNMGIYDFDVDGQGQRIAYSVRDDISRARDLYLLDLTTGSERQITFCGNEDAECYTPIFHPSDPVIAYVRVNSNTSTESFGTGAPRIWVLDLVTGTNRPLSDDSQIIGHSPIWSDSGDTIAYYSADLSNPGVLVYNFNPQINETQTLNFVPSYNGSVGTLSPNGLRLVVPDIVNRGEQVFTYLKLVDFTESPATFNNFSDPNGVTDDIAVEWHPDGQSVTVGRRFTDDRWTRGYQLFEIDADTGESSELVYDEAYGHYFFIWDNLGEQLLMQRLPLFDEDGNLNNLARPEIWVLDAASGDLTRIAESGYFPRWVIPN